MSARGRQRCKQDARAEIQVVAEDSCGMRFPFVNVKSRAGWLWLGSWLACALSCSARWVCCLNIILFSSQDASGTCKSAATPVSPGAVPDRRPPRTRPHMQVSAHAPSLPCCPISTYNPLLISFDIPDPHFFNKELKARAIDEHVRTTNMPISVSQVTREYLGITY